MLAPRRLFLLLLAVVAVGGSLGAQEPALTREQIKQFLLTAKIVANRSTDKGVTRPFRLTLSDGTISHDAGFSHVDERAHLKRFEGPKTELNFVDSWRYNVAAYELAVLVGLDDMVPVTVEREWRGMKGSLTWWLPVTMDEGQRLEKQLRPPDPEAWDRQTQKVRVFTQLVYDTDRNLGNLLITADWKIWMIDFTRAFRRWDTLPRPGELERCDRQLLATLRALDRAAIAKATGKYLTQWEVDAVAARRRAIVAHFDKLIAEKGEGVVLY